MARTKNAWYLVPFTNGGYGLNVRKNQGHNEECEYVVRQQFTLEEDGSRMLIHEMSPDEAISLAHNLLEAAEKAKKRNG